MQSGCRRKIQSVTADAGYASEENYTYLEENEQEAYIKPTDYEVRKTKRFKENIYRVENLIYDEEKDLFICPNGKRLFFAGESHEKTESGYVTTKKNYVCESCNGCPHRDKCYKAKEAARRISVSQTMQRLKREAAERINTERGIVLRQNRSIQVEGAFGVLKEDFGFRRFLTRGKAKTESQFFILAIAESTSTATVTVFTPPAVEPGLPPINIYITVNANDAGLSAAVSTVLKPAVLGVIA